MNEKLMSAHKNLYRNVYRSFIHDKTAPNWKQPIYSSIGEQIKQTVVYPYNGLLVSKRNELSILEKRNGGTLNAYY